MEGENAHIYATFISRRAASAWIYSSQLKERKCFGMKYTSEDAAEREDLIRNITKMLRVLNVKQLQQVAWNIEKKWGFGK